MDNIERKDEVDTPLVKRLSSSERLSADKLSQRDGTGRGDHLGMEGIKPVSSLSQSADKSLQDGSVILGRNGPSGHVYTTRYVINRRRQRHGLCEEVLHEAFLPCTLDENRTSVAKFLWAIISSETFVFSLHMTVLAFGVAKEALNLREVDEDMHIIHSVIETFVTNLMITIRVNTARVTFKELRGHVTAVEHVEDPSSKNVRGRDLRRWLLRYYFLAALLVVISVACFLAFFFLVHLGWTILSNNFCLVAITVSSNLLLDRINAITARIREDQHKAVLYETVLLLQEANDAKTQEERNMFFQRARTFSKAFLDTELFSRPEHIEADETKKSDWSTVPAMEMQSFV